MVAGVDCSPVGDVEASTIFWVDGDASAARSAADSCDPDWRALT